MEPGRLLVSVPGMHDRNFENTVVYVFDTSGGAAGVVLNRPTDIPVADAIPRLALSVAPPGVVFHGGPVQVEHGIVLAVAGAEISAIDTEEAADVLPESIRVFAGYAGWEDGQLETEIADKGWFTVAADPDDILTPDPTGLWRAVLGRQAEPLRRYGTYPDDPRLN